MLKYVSIDTLNHQLDVRTEWYSNGARKISAGMQVSGSCSLKRKLIKRRRRLYTYSNFICFVRTQPVFCTSASTQDKLVVRRRWQFKCKQKIDFLCCFAESRDSLFALTIQFGPVRSSKPEVISVQLRIIAFAYMHL